ncbi:MAG: dTDP-4-amino-4,6-dideoxygalactose transaminase [Balneola sp.]|nr:dTDP-4-amino-4,6-dideoxygalactose transaminase [Balneola sp.]|tara:strand:- start:2220 stop:3356 length:1137 start_codon:yes stop_codon:yes gene_type:complete
MIDRIPFNRQNLYGPELKYIEDAYLKNKVSGDGFYTHWCQSFIEEKFGLEKVLLTTSGTHALEMAMLLIDIGPGDEVIMPSYTFVSTANAVVLRGAKPVFVDIRPDTQNIDERLIEQAITNYTKAIMPVHYAGVSCEMDTIMDIAQRHELWVVEDAAQGINAQYKDKYLGGIGHLGCYSFHETKNISMGEGGALIINDPCLKARAEIIREKGTNRSKFYRGEVDKYSWVDIGSSFLPSDINAAVLKAQLEYLDEIQLKRNELYQRYHKAFSEFDKNIVTLPIVPNSTISNAHMFYLLLESSEQRDSFISHMKSKNILVVFHYVPLHTSNFAHQHLDSYHLPRTVENAQKLVRLPIFFSLTHGEQQRVIDAAQLFLTNN